MERPGNSDKSEALGEARNQAQSRAASRSERAGSVFIAWPKRAGRTALSLLVVSFLVQALALSLFISPVAEAANQPTSGSQSVASADPTTPTPAPQVRQPDKNSDGPRISFADEQKLHPSVSEEKRIVPPPAARPAVAAGPPPKMNIASNFQPDTHPNLNPHFINTYYANKNTDDAGTDASCGNSGNTTCSLRSAITVANGDGHGTTQDLVLLASGTLYQITSSLPGLSGYITLSNSSDQSCPGGLPYVAILINNGMPANSDILTLDKNDVISGIDTDGATQDGTVITGSNNVLTCSIAERSLRNGVSIKAGAANNQIGLAGNGGTIGNIDFSAVNNSYDGILISGTGATGNVIKNAGVGYYPPNQNLPNGTGITIAGGATNNRIGSATNPQQYVNLIEYNLGDGVDISGTGTNGNFVTGSYIGVDKTGLTLAANALGQVRIDLGASNNTIGGDRAGGFGNLLAGSGSSRSNVFVSSNANIVQGNVIGLKANFSDTFTNAGNGVRVFPGGDNTQILSNIIGGNAANGIQIYGANNNTVYGNYIGTDPTATRTNLGNALDGINIRNGSSNNQIGGPGGGQANYIGGNGYSGININGEGTNNNKVQGNVIGVKGDFSGPLSNGTSVGTRIGATVCTPGSGGGGTADVQSEDCQGVFITATDGLGPTGNLIGGDSRAGQGNLIASTASKYIATGVMLDFAIGNTVQGNSIGARIAGGTVTGYPSPNNTTGIRLINGAANNQIGGDSSQGQGNLLGSVDEGIDLTNYNFRNGTTPAGPMNANKVQGNAIGVDFGGTANSNLAIGLNDIFLGDFSFAGLNNNLIGVDYSAATPNPKLGNLLGNVTNAGGVGIYANLNTGNYDSGNQFNGNYIGVKPDGSAGAGNPVGIELNGTINSRVQGNYIGAANLSIAATSYGLLLGGSESNATVTGNYIGTNAAGADLHNSIGVLVGNGSKNNTFSQNTIGRNTIQGFQLIDTTANRNTFSQNSIFGNGGPGINLNYTAANPNGIVGGNSTGPNNQAAKPTITAATLARNTLKVSGTANPASFVEIFLGDDSSSTQGKIYLATVPTNALNNAGTFTDVVLAIPGGISFPPNPKLVATSTLLVPPGYAGSTSQFSDAFNNPTLIAYLSVTPTSLNFGATQGGSNPAAQTANLTANFANVNFSSNIVYGTGASGWLTVSPASGTANAGSPVALTFTASSGSLAAGTYTATATFQDTANASDTATVTVTLTISAAPPPTTYNYNLPLLANGANTAVGQTTTYVTFQNLANSPASFTLQYYDINTGAAAAQQVFTLPALGQAAPALNLTPGQSYGGIVSSSQPLNLVVAEGLSSGGSAYNVSSATASTLYSPLALNGQYGFTTNITVFNGGSATSTGNLLFFDDAGNPVPGATKPFNVPAHASQTFKQADGGSGLASNHAYWAKIVAANATDSLTAQVIEFGPGNFVATFNAIVPAQVASTLYAPATFNGNYNFVTGMAIANPNGAAATVNIKYYVADGTNVFTQTNVPIAANGVIGIFQPNVSGLPANVTSAVISSNQPLISTVNERGPGTIAGTYVGLATGKTNVALPVMANGAFGFVTGATVFNTGSSPAHFTFSYLKPDGTSAVAAQSITLAPNASFLVFQGDAAQALPNGFFGTAIITSDQALLVTTNALNTSNNLFYTYTEPSS